MMQHLFIRAGQLSVNVAAISVVKWSTAADGHTRATVWFLGDTDPAEIVGPAAAVLSDALSALEAAGERDGDLRPATLSLYTTEDLDQLDALRGGLVPSGPPRRA